MNFNGVKSAVYELAQKFMITDIWECQVLKKHLLVELMCFKLKTGHLNLYNFFIIITRSDSQLRSKDQITWSDHLTQLTHVDQWNELLAAENMLLADHPV